MVAQQCSVSVPSGLASAAIAASATSTAPWLLTLNTLMSHAPIKIAACASALAFAPLIYQMQANSTLRAEVLEHRRPRPGAVASASDAAALRQKQADLRTAVDAKRAARIASENRVGELAAIKVKLDQEVVMSFGTVENMARKLARVISTMEQLEASKGDKLEPGSEALKERERRARELSQAAPEMLSIVREIPKLERDSAKAARFYATMFGEVGGFDEAARTTMEQDFATWLRGLQNEGLALAQRPQGKAPEWDARRNAAMLQLFSALQAKLPPPAKDHLQWDDIIGIHASAEDGMYEFLTTGNRP